jgi:hypothetical protein
VEPLPNEEAKSVPDVEKAEHLFGGDNRMKKRTFSVPASFLLVVGLYGLGQCGESLLLGGVGTTGLKTAYDVSVAHPGTNTITFEGVGDQAPVGIQSGAVFGSGWLCLVDSDAGGTGNFANEPSPNTIAVPSSATTQAETRITLPDKVNQVSFYYVLDTSTTASVGVYFYDQNDNLLGSKAMDVCGAVYCGNNCTGDPTGDFCSWTKLGASYSGIKYVEFEPVGIGSWGIDNFQFVILVNKSVPTLSEWGMIALSILLACSALWVIKRRKETI